MALAFAPHGDHGWIHQTGILRQNGRRSEEYVFIGEHFTVLSQDKWEELNTVVNELREQEPEIKELYSRPLCADFAACLPKNYGLPISLEPFQFAIQFDTLCHVTSWSPNGSAGVQNILRSGYFKGGPKKFGSIKGNFSWWTIVPKKIGILDSENESFEASNDIHGDVKKRVQKMIPRYSESLSAGGLKDVLPGYLGLDNPDCTSQELMDKIMGIAAGINDFTEALSDSFLKSPAFNKSSRYGNFKFEVSMQSLLRKFEESICDDVSEEQKYVFRVFCTVRYTYEIMQVILVHRNSAEENRYFQNCPVIEIDGGGTPVVTFHNGKGYWRPDSTGEKMVYPNDWRSNKPPKLWSHYVRNDPRCWEHLSFAFHIPEDKDGIKFDRAELVESCSVCEIENPYLGKGARLSGEDAETFLSGFIGR